MKVSPRILAVSALVVAAGLALGAASTKRSVDEGVDLRDAEAMAAAMIEEMVATGELNELGEGIGEAGDGAGGLVPAPVTPCGSLIPYKASLGCCYVACAGLPPCFGANCGGIPVGIGLPFPRGRIVAGSGVQFVTTFQTGIYQGDLAVVTLAFLNGNLIFGAKEHFGNAKRFHYGYTAFPGLLPATRGTVTIATGLLDSNLALIEVKATTFVID